MTNKKSSIDQRGQHYKRFAIKTLKVAWEIFKVLVGLSLTVIWAILAVALSFGGVNIPERRYRKKGNRDVDQLRKNLKDSSLSKIQEEFSDELDEYKRGDEVSHEEVKVIDKLKSFDRSKYDIKMRDLFQEDEIDTLVIIILKILARLAG